VAEVPALDRPNIVTRMTAPAGGNAEAVFGGFIHKSAECFQYRLATQKKGDRSYKIHGRFRTTSRSKRNGPSSGGDRGRGARD
jgi:hypothetical protein